MNNLPPIPPKKIPKLMLIGNPSELDLQQLKQYADEVQVVKSQEDTMKDSLETVKACETAKQWVTYEMPKYLRDLLSGGEKGIPYKRSSPKIGRNQPCPCGSLLKYKHCCLNKKQ
jgi:uncharacterized protein YecA (UPF0149 family)